jgi:hypothetical protein
MSVRIETTGADGVVTGGVSPRSPARHEATGPAGADGAVA